MIVKIHKKDARSIIAVCDEAIIGKTFEEGDTILDLSSDFYKGDKLTTEETGDLIRNADIVNLVGINSVKLGISEGIIDEANVKEICGIKYAQAVIEEL
ncbi:DUF424 domain-containing protein [Nanoarchaeota archaeon]